MEELHNTTVREQEYSDPTTQRTIIDLIDVESGDFVDANMLDTMTEAELTRLKELQSIAKKSGKYKYVCAMCGQPLRLDSRQFASKRYKSYFFSHYSNGDDCPLKSTYDAMDPIRSTIKWYSHFKESNLHKDMCQKLMEVLALDKRFSELCTYPTINIYGENVHWHKPDVSANFYGSQLVFETLMYNTFLSSVIDKDSFYRMANSFLIWLFPYFSIDNQKMCEKDVYYTHRRNIFVFDSEDYYRTSMEQDSPKPLKPALVGSGYRYAQEESMRRGRLVLNCFWQTPVMGDNGINIEWHHKLVGIEELTFDALRKDVFFHNCDYDFKEVADARKRKLIEDWERAKEERWSNVLLGIQERKKRYEQALGKKIARENERDMLSRVLAGEVIPKPFEDKVQRRYGYKAEEVVMIKPQYGFADTFRNGVAIVGNKRGLRGLINLRNERVIDINYANLSWLSKEDDRLLIVGHYSNHFRIFDKYGEIVLPYELYDIQERNGHFIFVTWHDLRYGIMSREGNVILEPVYDKIIPKDDGRFLLRYAGRERTFSGSAEEIITNVISELSPGQNVAERLLAYGVVNEHGDVTMPFEYSKIERVSDKFVLIEKSVQKKMQYGLMDNDLRIVVPLDKMKISLQPNGFFLRGGTLLDSNLNIILDDYASINPCPNGCFVLAVYVRGDWGRMKYGLANEHGNILFPCIASDMVADEEGNVEIHEMTLDNGRIIKRCFGIYALFDAKGAPLTSSSYSSMEPLPNGTLLVSIGDKQGIIDIDGNELVRCAYDRLDLTESGDVEETVYPLDDFCQKKYSLGKYALCDRNGKELTGLMYESIEALSSGIYIARTGYSNNLLDKTGEPIFKSDSSTEYSLCKNQFIIIEHRHFYIGSDIEKKKEYGVIDFNGKPIVPVGYSRVEVLANGNILVAKKDSGEIVYGLFSPEGSVIADCKYKELHTDDEGNLCPTYAVLKNGFFAAHMYDKYALADSGKVVLTGYTFDSIEYLDKCMFVAKTGDQYSLLDNKGKVVNEMRYSTNYSFLGENMIQICNGNLYGIITLDGTTVVPVEYSSVRLLPNGNILVSKTIKSYYYGGSDQTYFGLYKSDGTVIAECKYRELHTDEEGNPCATYTVLRDGIFAMCLYDKYALANSHKELLTDYLYDSVKVFDEKYFEVVQNSVKGLVDCNGEVLLTNVAWDVEILEILSEDRFLIKKNNHKGVVNASGSVIVPTDFTNVTKLANNTWKVKKDYPNTVYGIISDTGEVVYDCKYRELVTDDEGCVVPTYAGSDDTVYKARMLDKYALCTDDKKTITDYLYDDIQDAGQGFFIVVSGNEQGVIDRFANIILPMSDRVVKAVIDKNSFVVQKKALFYSSANRVQEIIDREGNVVFSSPEEIKLDENHQPVTTIIAVWGDRIISRCCGRYAIGYKGQLSLSDYEYHSVTRLNDSIYMVKTNMAGYGLMNAEGKLILPMKYSPDFECLSAGIIKFCIQDWHEKKYGLCSSSGEILAEPSYSFIRENSPGHFKLFYIENGEKKSKFLNIKQTNSFVVNQVYTGIVTGIQDYGIFVKVPGYGSGLLHAKRIRKAGKEIDSFTKGDKVSVKVIKIKDDGKVEFGF